MQRYALAKYTLIEAWKRRLIYLHVAAMLIGLLLATYAASLVMTDKGAVQAMFYGFLLRLLLTLTTAGYIILTEMHNLERENAFLWLGLPVSRARYLAEKTLAYIMLVIATAVTGALPLLLMQVGSTAAVVWTGTFLLEMVAMVALALMLSTLCRQPLTALSLFGAIYLFARASGSLYRQSGDVLADAATWYERGLAMTVHTTTWLVPHLERFAAAQWLMHPQSATPDWTTLVLQIFLYSAVLLLIALERLQRRGF